MNWQPDQFPTDSSGPPAPRRHFPSFHLGLEGQILLTVTASMILAISATCWMWAQYTGDRINQMIGGQASQMASALSLAAGQDLAGNNTEHLKSITSEILKSHNALCVAFYDPAGRSVAASSSEGFAPDGNWLQRADIESLTRVQEGGRSGQEFLRVCTPVLAGEPQRLAGYVTVALSPATEQLHFARVCIFAAGIGCIIMLLSLPLAYGLVHRIFFPIRELVDATHKISAGEAEVHVDIHRPDAIGVLARAFNEMVETIGSQRQALQDANGELEEKVNLRTGQLQAANKRLSGEIAEKEDFLRAVSHDLNAPLRNISGMAMMLLNKYGKNLDADIVHRLDRIQKNVEAETGLISELLELSRIKTRRQKMELVEIGPLVRELEELFENDLKSKHIALKLDTPLPVLQCERARFRQVFQNLLDNAIKYMGDGEVREIRIGCTVRLTEAEFYVSDTGMGIDPEDVDKVFYVFRRGKNASSTIAGKGVGLASVKSIIETYNGTIWVQSRRGEGSTFTFTVNGAFVPESQTIAAKAGKVQAAPELVPATTEESIEEAGTALAEQLEV